MMLLGRHEVLLGGVYHQLDLSYNYDFRNPACQVIGGLNPKPLTPNPKPLGLSSPIYPFGVTYLLSAWRVHLRLSEVVLSDAGTKQPPGTPKLKGLGGRAYGSGFRVEGW